MDPRLAAAIEARRRLLGQGQSAPSVVANGPAQDAVMARFAPPPQQSSGGWTLPSVAAQEEKQSSSSGFAGVLGFALNNPVSRTLLRPLQAFDYPRSMIVSGLKELQDAAHGGDANFTDWVTQAQEHIGVGDIIDTDKNNTLTDKLLGIAGDVALDPLTYVTFGTGRFAGSGGRLAAAGEFAAKAADESLEPAARALAKQATEKVGRLGVGALSEEERALIGLDKAGLRFMGGRIPGTEGVANALSGAGGAARAGIQSSRIGNLLRRGPGRTPELMEAAERLLAGRGDLDAVDAANRVAFHVNAKGVGGRFRTIHVKRAEEVAKSIGRSSSVRSDLTHAIETGAQGELYDAGRQVFQGVRDDAVYKYGINLEKIGGAEYMPHRLTDEGRNILDKVENDVIVSNKGAASMAQRHRELRTGQKVSIGGKTAVVPEDDTIRGLNQWFKDTWPEVVHHDKVFEDDFVKLSDIYIEEVARSVGRAAGFDTLLKRGSAWLPDDPEVSRPSARVLQERAKGKAFEDATLAKRGISQAYKNRPLWHDFTRQLELPFDESAITEMHVATHDPLQHADRMQQLEQQLSWADLDEPTRAAQQAELSSLRSAVEAPGDRAVIAHAPGDETVNPDAFIKVAETGKFDKAIERELKYGFEQVGKELLGGEGLVVKAQMANSLNNVQQAINKGGFWKVIDKYTQFFKQYATLQPGFHLRNSMSATFMNFADGVSMESQLRGIKQMSSYLKDPAGYLESLPLHDRELMDNALTAVYGSGGGAGQYSADELVMHGGRIVDNPVTRFSRKAGAYVEGVARMGMAIDTLTKGGTVEEAIQRIARIHFDYSELSNMDRTMKRFIPFWTFMSRNLPMQTQEMWLKPRLYQQYQSVVRNMGEDYENDMVPQSWQDVDAFKLTDGTYLAPDFAHTRQLKDLEELGDIEGGRFLADLNPVFRLPLEMFVADKQFFSGHKFEPNKFEELTFNKSPEIAALRPLLQMLGQVDRAGPNGEVPVINEKLDYALHQLLPTLSQAQRVLPSQDEYYGDRHIQSGLSLLGIPLKQLSGGQVEREKLRRQFAQGDDERSAKAKADALRRFLEGG